MPGLPRRGLPVIGLGGLAPRRLPGAARVRPRGHLGRARATPSPAQVVIMEAVRAARGSAAYRQSLGAAGAVPFDLDGNALRAVLARDHARQLAVLRRPGIEPE